MSIRPGWFYHENEEPHPLERLVDTYIRSVGSNAAFNLNIPPMPNGRFNEKDIRRAVELGEALRSRFGEAKKVPYTCEKTVLSDTQAHFTLTLPEKTRIAYVELDEDIAKGQRVEQFRIMAEGKCVYQGYTAGYRKICPLETETDRVTIEILSARDTVELRDIIVYRE